MFIYFKCKLFFNFWYRKRLGIFNQIGTIVHNDIMFLVDSMLDGTLGHVKNSIAKRVWCYSEHISHSRVADGGSGQVWRAVLHLFRYLVSLGIVLIAQDGRPFLYWNPCSRRNKVSMTDRFGKKCCLNVSLGYISTQFITILINSQLGPNVRHA